MLGRLGFSMPTRRQKHSLTLTASIWLASTCWSASAFWNQRRRVDADTADSDSESATDIGEPPWKLMAYLVKGATDEELTVADLWEDERIPQDANEWKTAFKVIARYIFPTWEDLAQWWIVDYTSLERRASDARRRAAGEVSQQSLQVLDRWNVVRSRITSELAKRMVLYSELQRRGHRVEGSDLAKRTQYRTRGAEEARRYDAQSFRIARFHLPAIGRI